VAFTVEDVQDLIRLLAERPEWRAQLRPLILGDEFDRLPRIVEELAEAQRRTEQRLEELAEAQRRTEQRLEELGRRVDELAEAQRRTEQRVEELAEAQRRTEQRLEELGRRVDELAEAQRRTEQRVDELAARLEELTARVDQLAARVDELVQAVGVMRVDINRAHQRLDAELGYLYEMRFERKAPSLFGKWLRKPRVVTLSDLDLVDEAEDAGKLDERELVELRALDLIIEGRDRSDPAQRPLLLAVEISRTIDADDVSRALTRAKALEKAGYRARAAVGGRAIDERARVLAEAAGVLVRVADDLAA
jgi:outer membrane murein-binding lipoprotein Lpp